MKKVVLSQKARSYLLSEARHLRECSPAAAVRFIERTREGHRNLTGFKAIGFEREVRQCQAKLAQRRFY